MNKNGGGGNTGQAKTKVFISYSRRDRTFADGLANLLEKKDIKVLIDRKDIIPGEPWEPRIYNLINKADTVIFIITTASVSSPICKKEVAYADGLNKRFIPMLRGDPVDQSGQYLDVPEALARINYINATPNSDFEYAINALIVALKNDLPWVREHTRLGELALRWQKSGEVASQLLHGKDVGAAEQWRDNAPKETNPPTELQLNFISQSRSATIRRTRNWRVGTVIAASIVLGGVVALMDISKKRQMARTQQTNLEVNNANSLASSMIFQQRNTDASLILLESLVNNPNLSAKKNKRIYDASLNLLRASYAGATEATLLSGHTNRLVNAIFNEDGSLIATASFDNSIRILEASQGKLKSLIKTDLAHSLIAFGAQGKSLYTLDLNGWIHLWDIAKNRSIVTPDRVLKNVFAFNHDKTRLAYLIDAKTIRIVDGHTFKFVRDLSGHEKQISALDYSPDGLYLGSTSWDKTARIWHTNTGVLKHELRGHSEEVGTLQFSPDSDVLATGSKDGTIRLWWVDPDEGDPVLDKILRLFPDEPKLKGDPVTQLKFSPDGEVIAAVAGTGFHLWDPVIGGRPAALIGVTGGVRSIAFSPDGTRIAAALFDPNREDIRKEIGVHIWDAEGSFPSSGDKNSLLQPDDAPFRYDNLIRNPVRQLLGHEGSVLSLAYSPDGKRLLTGAADGTARLWNPWGGINTVALDHEFEDVLSAFFSGNDELLVTMTRRRKVRVWNLKARHVQSSYELEHDCFKSMRFTGNKARFLCKNANQLEERVSLTGKLVAKRAVLKVDEVLAVVSVSGEYYLTAEEKGAGDLNLWETKTGKVIRSLRGQNGGLTIVALSSDGLQILTGGLDGTVRLWDSLSSETEAKQTIKWPFGAVFFAQFTDQNKKIAMVGAKTTIATWDIEKESWQRKTKPTPDQSMSVMESWRDGQRFAVGYYFEAPTGGNHVLNIATATGSYDVKYVAHTDFINTVGISADGNFALSGSNDSRVLIWPLHQIPDILIAQSIKAIPRCIAVRDRKALVLKLEPPRWCITGSVNKALPRAKWVGKWPYHTKDWSDWLAATDRGEQRKMPEQGMVKKPAEKAKKG